MVEEDEHPPSEFYYTEDLERTSFDVETETGITESQDAKNYNKQLTNRVCLGRTGEYWRSVYTAKTLGQYSPVRPSRSV